MTIITEHLCVDTPLADMYVYIYMIGCLLYLFSPFTFFIIHTHLIQMSFVMCFRMTVNIHTNVKDIGKLVLETLWHRLDLTVTVGERSRGHQNRSQLSFEHHEYPYQM